jgi:hypothetical protein
MEKPGINKIQLPSSMAKVGPSTKQSNVETTCQLINANGVQPSSTDFPKVIFCHQTKMSRAVLRSNGIRVGVFSACQRGKDKDAPHAFLCSVDLLTESVHQGLCTCHWLRLPVRRRKLAGMTREVWDW